jgi:hypothetical protein
VRPDAMKEKDARPRLLGRVRPRVVEVLTTPP